MDSVDLVQRYSGGGCGGSCGGNENGSGCSNDGGGNGRGVGELVMMLVKLKIYLSATLCIYMFRTMGGMHIPDKLFFLSIQKGSAIVNQFARVKTHDEHAHMNDKTVSVYVSR